MCGIIDLYFLHKSGFIFCITQAGKVSSNPGKLHFEVLVHLLRYIRETKNLGLGYYTKIEYVPISGIFIQAIVNTENQLMVLSASICQECKYTGRSTGAYILFYQGEPIDNFTHVTGPVAQSSAESE